LTGFVVDSIGMIFDLLLRVLLAMAPVCLPLLGLTVVFWLMFRSVPGVKELKDGAVHGTARVFVWAFGTLWRLNLMVLFTCVDGAISLGHTAFAPLRAQDHWFDFLQRFNDRFYKLMIR